MEQNNQNTSEEVLEQKVTTHMVLCTKLTETYQSKNHDYNDAFHKRFLKRGMTYAVDKMQEKLDRIEALSHEGNKNAVEDEPLTDSLMDLANYAIMTLIEMAGPDGWRECSKMVDKD